MNATAASHSRDFNEAMNSGVWEILSSIHILCKRGQTGRKGVVKRESRGRYLTREVEREGIIGGIRQCNEWRRRARGKGVKRREERAQEVREVLSGEVKEGGSGEERSVITVNILRS
ncbi:hypothetical protein Pcinc_044275 [Petrolisthes cinctipes]|uniref:Uncharacterized protein n=1 Tax=Petrolisthes cinctipes TaxID=88211 RepID=A0AAE1EH29_PETCI|nr:hypothetical protein Pcinc_044275 [Petrolisthes cinctipes]